MEITIPIILPEEPPLHRAARFGDLATLEQLIADGADINQAANLSTEEEYYEDFNERLTPLMIAACSTAGATVETLQWLLDHGANLHQTSARGVTAAWYVAGNGDFSENQSPPHSTQQSEKLRFLLDAGLDAQESTHEGESLMTAACNVGDPERVRLLLERGVSPLPRLTKTDDENEKYSDLSMRSIPLHCAVSSDSAESVRLLLAAGADPNQKAYGDEPALAHAVSHEVAQILIAAGAQLAVESVYYPHWDVLDLVLDRVYDEEDTQWNFPVAESLLAAGDPLNRTNKNGDTRVHEAAFRHKAENVDFLLAKGAALTMEGSHDTPLHSICWQGEYNDSDINFACERIVRALVRAGNPLEARDPQGRTPLHKAVGGDRENDTAIRVLIELGADLNSRDDSGQTPLHMAARKTELSCVVALLAAGADTTICENDGYTARAFAQGIYDYWIRLIAEDSSSVPEDQLRRWLEESKQVLDALPPA